MPKQLPAVHSCVHCKSLILAIIVDSETEVQTLQAWKKFASAKSVAALDTDDDLASYLRSQLKTLNTFLSVTPQEARKKAEAGCRLFAYILKKTENIVKHLRDGGTSVESNDLFKPFYGQHVNSAPRSDADIEERLFICTEAQPGKQPSSTWRFRWFVEPYRPFHCLHFQVDDDVEGAHISDDNVGIDLFQTIVNSGSAYPEFPRYFDFEPGSDESIARAREFFRVKPMHLEDVVESSFVPTRLIEFDIPGHGPLTQVKLVDYRNASDGLGYAALSYCWGGDQKLKLTRTAFEQFTQGIAFETLPMTLRDAITVASKFDIKYLWIDALCIIQDDDEDMGRELAVMAQIYENASLTISASRASSVEEGFLQERLPFKDNASFAFCLWLQLPDGDHAESVLCFLAADMVGHVSPNMKISEAASDGTPRDPLILRAWCFQERALSKRLIEFGILSTRIQVTRPGLPVAIYNDSWKPLDEHHSIPFTSWSVADLLATSDNSKSQPRGFRRLSNGFNVYSNTSTVPPGMEGVYGYWCSTLTFYSGLGLSFQKDRLPAFSAIASSFAQAFGGKENYIAGIWRDTMPLGLLWVVYSENAEKDGIPSDPPAAPSWSWASVSSVISYTWGREHQGAAWEFGKNFLANGLKTDQDTEVLGYKIKLATEKVAFGAVDHGKLRLRGRLLPVRLSLEKSLGLENLEDATRMEIAQSHQRIAQDFLDERGLHRRNYEHPDVAFRERRLAALTVIDRREEAFETMVAGSQGLFALPIASGPSEKTEKGINERIWGIQMPPCRCIFGILVLNRGDGTYQRIGWFKFSDHDVDWFFDDWRLDMEDVPKLLQDQYTWMQSGELQEFALV
ncbi:hypothetical protein TruAng_001670 [Truncatella angustata]|nr:hypothetical protein TruAng_001670 [Truncatella angustata]